MKNLDRFLSPHVRADQVDLVLRCMRTHRMGWDAAAAVVQRVASPPEEPARMDYAQELSALEQRLDFMRRHEGMSWEDASTAVGLPDRPRDFLANLPESEPWLSPLTDFEKGRV